MISALDQKSFPIFHLIFGNNFIKIARNILFSVRFSIDVYSSPFIPRDAGLQQFQKNIKINDNHFREGETSEN